MAKRPSEQEAQAAEHYLESAILQFSDEARAPRERGTPNPDPTWKPRRSTLRFNPLRGGGWLWSMNSQDPQIVAYYVMPASGEPFGRVTAHGQARHNFQLALKERHAYPTASPSYEWYDYMTRYKMDSEER